MAKINFINRSEARARQGWRHRQDQQEKAFGFFPGGCPHGRQNGCIEPGNGLSI
jgi:hypothetical protein